MDIEFERNLGGIGLLDLGREINVSVSNYY